MKGYLFESEYKGDKSTVTANLLLLKFIDDAGVHFVYSPHLDLTGYGINPEEAKESFRIAYGDFIDYTVKKGTLQKVLKKLGWSVSKRKMLVPSIASVIKERDYLSEVFDKYPVQTMHEQVYLPLSA